MKKLLSILMLLVAIVTGAWADTTYDSTPLVSADFSGMSDGTPAAISGVTYHAATISGGKLTWSGNWSEGSRDVQVTFTITGDACKLVLGHVTSSSTMAIKGKLIKGSTTISDFTGSAWSIDKSKTSDTKEFTDLSAGEYTLKLGPSGQSARSVITSIAIYNGSSGSSKTASQCTFATTAPAISFPGTATYTQVASTATGYDGTLNYTLSNNTCGASIDATTHEVTVTKEGSVTVTATASETTNYASSSASYTLTVTDSRTALTGAWTNAAPTFSVGESATRPTFTVSGGEVTESDYSVTYSVVSGTLATVDASTGITAINTEAAGTATVKATVTVLNTTDYTMATTEYNCVITVANTHTVTYNANGGSGVVPTDANTYAEGDEVTATDNIGTLTKAGYSIVGWNTDSEATAASLGFGSKFNMGNADVTLYAIWQENNYTFTPKTVTENENVGTTATIVSSVGGKMKNTQTDGTAGRLVYTSAGLLFAGSSNAKVTVTLNNELQVGSVITATFMYNDGKDNRGVDLQNAAGTAKAGWSFHGDPQNHTFAYTVTSTDGFAGTNSFSLKRRGNAYMKSLTVTNCDATKAYVEVGETGFATIGLPFATTLPTGVTAYAVESVTDSKVKMSSAIEPATTIPANTGLVIVAAPATYKFSQTGAGTWSGSNLLEAVGETPKAATTDAPIYVLAITDATNKKVGFKKSTSGSLGAYKAYLPGTVATGNSLTMDFDDATAINGVAEAKAEVAPVKVVKNGKLFIGNYNIAGQQVK